MNVDSLGQMRVLFVIDSLQQGGAERSLLDLIPEMRKLGVVSWVAISTAGSLEPLARDRNIEVLPLRGRNDVTRARDLVRSFREVHPDAVHTSLFRSSLLGRAAGGLTRTPVITSLTGESFSPTDTARLSGRARAADASSRAWMQGLVGASQDGSTP